MWYKTAKEYKEGAAETIIRRLIEQQVRKRLFLQGDQYASKEDVCVYVKRIMKEILEKYGDFDLIRQKQDILDYDKFVKKLVEEQVRIFEDRKSTRKAGVDEDNFLYCDICEASEKNGIEIDYNEWEDKHLCPECASALEEERDAELYSRNVWENMSPSEQNDAIRNS